MKQHLSVLGLLIRCSLWRILLILLLMVVIQGGLFAFALHRAIAANQPGLELIISGSQIALVFGAAFLLITAQLCTVGCSYSTQTGYTISRLSLPQRDIFFCQAAVNTLFFLLFWAVEGIAVYGFALYFTRTVDPAAITGQTVFLAFYRSKFLHGLLPLDQISIYIRNITALVALGITTAIFPYRQRRKSFGTEIVVLLVFLLLLFPRQTNEIASDVFLIVLSLSLIATALTTIFAKEDR